jgi:thioesterase domain-containing protein
VRPEEGPAFQDPGTVARPEGPGYRDQDVGERPEGPAVSRPGREAGIKSPIQTERRRRGTPPRTRVELQLAQVWKEVLNVQEVYLEDDFFRLGGHSLLAAKLFNRIRNAFNVDLPLGLVFEAPTLLRLSELVSQRERQAITGDIVLIRPGRSTRCLFYLPGVGGHTLNFYQLSHCMNIPLPQYGMNLPGFHGDQEPCRTIEDMATYFIGLMRKVQPEGPYFLCGFSLGGRIAYEMALQLAQERAGPVRLYILGTGAPGFPRTTTNRLIRYSREFATFCRLSLSGKVEYVRWIRKYKRSEREEKRKQTILTDEDFDLPRFRAVFQAGVEAWVRYSPTARFNGEMSLFREVANPHPLYRHLYANKTFDWDRFVSGPIRVYDIDCEHPDILRQPHVQVCAGILQQEIMEALPETVRQ